MALARFGGVRGEAPCLAGVDVPTGDHIDSVGWLNEGYGIPKEHSASTVFGETADPDRHAFALTSRTSGGMAERTKAAVLKTAVRFSPHRGFESHSLRSQDA